MEVMDPRVLELYQKSLNEVGQFEAPSSAKDLSVLEVLRAHYLIADYFVRDGVGDGKGLGGIGPKSVDMLVSAVSRQNVSFGGVEKWVTVHQRAATLLFGLVMNHPFHDANKRTAYLSVIHYYRINGYVMSASEKELEDFTVMIAEKGLVKFSRYKDLSKTSGDPEVEFIAHWLKVRTRRVDGKEYIITYRELDRILRRYDAWLENPHGNYISLMRKRTETVTVRKFFSTKKVEREVIDRVCNIGFPGWSKQVGKGRISHIRKSLGLTVGDGVDSKSFFDGVDDMQMLIQVYEGALKRLADR